MSNHPILTLRNVNKSFHQGTEHLHILSGASLTIKPGEMVALVGPSGSGKSTLLQIAGLLDSADSGTVMINSTNCSKATDSERTAIRRQSLGFVYQFHHLLPDFTALENVSFPLLISGESKKDAAEKSQQLLASLGLGERLHHRPSELSGGEQQRVAIARAIITGPSLLLADEPTGNLDPTAAESVFALLVKVVRYIQLSALIVTHNPELAQKMDRRITIQHGTIVEL